MLNFLPCYIHSSYSLSMIWDLSHIVNCNCNAKQELFAQSHYIWIRLREIRRKQAWDYLQIFLANIS